MVPFEEVRASLLTIVTLEATRRKRDDAGEGGIREEWGTTQTDMMRGRR